MKMPRIMCAVCRKPVDYVEWGVDLDRRNQWIMVKCHGDTDRMEITCTEIERMTPDQIRALNCSTGVAFTTKRVTQKETPDLSGRG